MYNDSIISSHCGIFRLSIETGYLKVTHILDFRMNFSVEYSEISCIMKFYYTICFLTFHCCGLHYLYIDSIFMVLMILWGNRILE